MHERMEDPNKEETRRNICTVVSLAFPANVAVNCRKKETTLFLMLFPHLFLCKSSKVHAIGTTIKTLYAHENI